MLVPALFAQQLSIALLLGFRFAFAVSALYFQMRKRIALAHAGTCAWQDAIGL
ncbi:hypothetical protein [Glutamicibacter protophormiae]|uniref:hypothetical protein n=1 Tax=Glutamicibacter protophormiae TaxID=37930 RepID=UPI003A946954